MEFLSAAPTPRRHPRSSAKQRNRNSTRTQTALRAREPPSKTSPATRRFERRNLGPPVTTQPNSESRRLAPDNSNPPPITRGLDLRPCKPAPLSSPCAGSVPQKRNPPPPTQNFWPSLNLKEQSSLVRGNRPRTSYEESTYLICGIHLDRIMKASWDKAPCQLRSWETRELRPPGTAIRNKGRTNLDHRSCLGA
jgi:hypothetical protein